MLIIGHIFAHGIVCSFQEVKLFLCEIKAGDEAHQ